MNRIVDKAGAANSEENGSERRKRSHVGIHNMGQWWWWGGDDREAILKEAAIVIALLSGCALNEGGTDLVRRVERMVWIRWQPGRGVNWISVEILHMEQRLVDRRAADWQGRGYWLRWIGNDTQKCGNSSAAIGDEWKVKPSVYDKDRWRRRRVTIWLKECQALQTRRERVLIKNPVSGILSTKCG